MSNSHQTIAQALKEARKKMKLSQRQLSAKVRVPQSHISKIENGAVDLQVSSLIQLARSLDLELMLIPRALLLVVRALLRQEEHRGEKQVPAYRLKEGDDD